MAPMHRPGTTAVLQEPTGFEAVSEQVTALSRAAVPAALPVGGIPVAGIPATLAGVPSARTLPCTEDPDLFFAESPGDVEIAKDMCRDCPARLACLTGALERREPWGVWGGQLFLRGEIVPRKRPRGRPRKHEVAA
jgi:WhiB family transcriptional regulator, redox-sensing transcriptional regulator